MTGKLVWEFGNNFCEHGTIKPLPKKRFWTTPPMLRFPPPFVHAMSFRGNGHRPDQSHFRSPPKLALEGTLYGTFPPPNRTIRFAAPSAVSVLFPFENQYTESMTSALIFFSLFFFFFAKKGILASFALLCKEFFFCWVFSPSLKDFRGQLFYLQLELFYLQLSSFAYSPLRSLLDWLSQSKQKSSNCKQKS